MSTINEKKHTGEYLISEGNGGISREKGTLLTGFKYTPGMVLGKVTATGKYAKYNNAASNGTETAVAVCYDNYDATSADVAGAVVTARLSEVRKTDLDFNTTTTSDIDDAIVDLETKNIIVR